MAFMKFEVANFDGRSNNFNIWKIKIMALLRREGSVYALNDSYLVNTKVAEKQKIEMEAFSTIQLSLSDSVLCEVNTKKTAASLWKKLEDLYQKKSVTTRMLLRQRLHTFKIKIGTTLQDYLDAFNKLVVDLTHADIKVGDEELACTLLISLSPAYKDVVTSMMYSKKMVTLQIVRHALNSDELRNHINNGEKEDHGEGLTIRGHSSQRGRGKSVARSKFRKRVSKKDVECWGCQQKGHIGPNKKTDKTIASASTVQVAQTSGEDYVLTTSTDDIQTHKSILDSACTFHMYFKKDWFTSILDKLGYKHASEGGICKVTKGSLVMLKAKLEGGLYVIMGSTILGTANAATSQLSDDDKAKMWHMRLGLAKSNVFENFKNWKTLIENQCGRKIKCLRTDNGLEFCNEEFDNFYKIHGVLRHRNFRHTPQQNGVAETINRTLLEKAQCMLSNAKVPKEFWAEAVNTACYVVNRSPASVIDFKTPNEVWSGKLSDYSYLRVFGCFAYYHVSDGKLEPRARKSLFMGYAEGIKGYRIWSLDPIKFVICRDVTFDKASMLDPEKASIEFAG
ncbi:uncharacterized protein LOC132630572 [Lycium barbarum]|uniref:uncharacterized protein LOC132630572 n=1 Tax=Lycium barbarum TaxID=112863 RepID=UPI00293EDD40|nr:uncharacterized protein LOC132630572 [Lycium barbarum]